MWFSFKNLIIKYFKAIALKITENKTNRLICKFSKGSDLSLTWAEE